MDPPTHRVDNMSVVACARGLSIGWDMTNERALTAARGLAYDPARLTGVRVVGVDKHKWKLVSKRMLGRRHAGVRHRDRETHPLVERGRFCPATGPGYWTWRPAGAWPR